MVTFTETRPAAHIASLADAIAPEVPTIVRTRDDLRLEQLLESGADEVIPDTVESSMMLARHTLAAVGEDHHSITSLLEEARRENYATIRAYFHKPESDSGEPAGKHYLRSIEIADGFHAVGRSLDSLDCLQKLKMVGLRRGQSSIEAPAMDTELEAGDVLVVEGHPDHIQAAEFEIMSGR